MASESRQGEGGSSKVTEPGLVLARGSESGDGAFFSSGGGSLTSTVAGWELGEPQGCVLGADMLTLLVGL